MEAAKKEGKIVIAIPPSNELRKELETVLKQKFGIEAELVAAPGPKNASRIAAEKKAGVNYFDAIICGTGTAAGLTHDGMLEPMEPFWLLPEVRDPKQWWGGHIWEDNVSTHKFLYSFLADVATHGIWYNTSMVKAEEFKSFDDYINPKWKGKIGFSDPRIPSSGQSIWSFMWELKGEEFLKKFVQQELFLTLICASLRIRWLRARWRWPSVSGAARSIPSSMRVCRSSRCRRPKKAYRRAIPSVSSASSRIRPTPMPAKCLSIGFSAVRAKTGMAGSWRTAAPS